MKMEGTFNMMELPEEIILHILHFTFFLPGQVKTFKGAIRYVNSTMALRLTCTLFDRHIKELVLKDLTYLKGDWDGFIRKRIFEHHNKHWVYEGDWLHNYSKSQKIKKYKYPSFLKDCQTCHINYLLSSQNASEKAEGIRKIKAK